MWSNMTGTEHEMTEHGETGKTMISIRRVHSCSSSPEQKKKKGKGGI
jgi:hypothetical protein